MEEFPHRKAATSLLATIMADIENKASVAESGSPERAVEPAGVNDEGAIPKGTIDPVYEAKARVLNRAIQDIGNSLLLSGLDGRTITCGPSSPL